jgi:MFS family permease
MFAAVGVWIFLNWLPLFFQETQGMSLAIAGFSGTVLLQLPSVAGIVAGGVLSDRVATRDRAARMLVQTVCYLLATPVVLMFTMGAGFGFAATAVVGFALLRAIAMANENPLLCDLITSSNRSSAIGLMNAAQCFTGGIGVLVAGYLKQDYGLSGAFAAVSVVTLICSALTAFGYFARLRRDLAARQE